MSTTRASRDESIASAQCCCTCVLLFFNPDCADWQVTSYLDLQEKPHWHLSIGSMCNMCNMRLY